MLLFAGGLLSAQSVVIDTATPSEAVNEFFDFFNQVEDDITVEAREILAFASEKPRAEVVLFLTEPVTVRAGRNSKTIQQIYLSSSNPADSRRPLMVRFLGTAPNGIDMDAKEGALSRAESIACFKNKDDSRVYSKCIFRNRYLGGSLYLSAIPPQSFPYPVGNTLHYFTFDGNGKAMRNTLMIEPLKTIQGASASYRVVTVPTPKPPAPSTAPGQVKKIKPSFQEDSKLTLSGQSPSRVVQELNRRIWQFRKNGRYTLAFTGRLVGHISSSATKTNTLLLRAPFSFTLKGGGSTVHVTVLDFFEFGDDEETETTLAFESHLKPISCKFASQDDFRPTCSYVTPPTSSPYNSFMFLENKVAYPSGANAPLFVCDFQKTGQVCGKLQIKEAAGKPRALLTIAGRSDFFEIKAS